MQRIVERIPAEALTAEVVEKLYRYLNQHADRDGYLEYRSERWYGWLCGMCGKCGKVLLNKDR